MPPMRTTFYLAVDDAEIARWRALDPDREPHRLVLGEHYWIVLSYLRLRDAGADVALDNRMPAEGPVLFYAGDKRRAWDACRRAGSRALLVSVRSDRHPVGFADVEVVQNASSADGRHAFHVPHWPQPGLVVRDPGRGDRPRTILYPGTPQNLHPGFRDGAWQDFLAARGLHMRSHAPDGDVPPAYQDLATVDLMLAARPSGARLVRNKPAWKLFNAWLAGVPALLGPESGYRELREGPLDFIEVDGPAAAMAAIDRLLADPALYAAMADNGRRRGEAFSNEATVARWRRLIDEVLLPRAREQQAHPTAAWRRQCRDLGARLRRMVQGKG
ncbi:glycosyltransferase family protein [Marilutibacter aestuarii]|uniref:Glycosyltransferase family 4 protein n=1 Tax=Marilutibacter aestuarii TaxID=1706195 RepID=A0A507ZPI9_9GAMM|nr:glycosyltransferase [Lysobacter aestuarii]TQD39219.1 glycosyltransferase family 4 protein [Lysobacter aestuarii]